MPACTEPAGCRCHPSLGSNAIPSRAAVPAGPQGCLQVLRAAIPPWQLPGRAASGSQHLPVPPARSCGHIFKAPFLHASPHYGAYCFLRGAMLPRQLQGSWPLYEPHMLSVVPPWQLRYSSLQTCRLKLNAGRLIDPMAISLVLHNAAVPYQGVCRASGLVLPIILNQESIQLCPSTLQPHRLPGVTTHASTMPSYLSEPRIHVAAQLPTCMARCEATNRGLRCECLPDLASARCR